MYKLVVRVVSSKSYCDVHKVGDYFEVENDTIRAPEGKRVCIWSLSALLTFLSACQRAVRGSSDWLSTVEYIHCPDPSGAVVWKIERT